MSKSVRLVVLDSSVLLFAILGVTLIVAGMSQPVVSVYHRVAALFGLGLGPAMAGVVCLAVAVGCYIAASKIDWVRSDKTGRRVIDR